MMFYFGICFLFFVNLQLPGAWRNKFNPVCPSLSGQVISYIIVLTLRFHSLWFILQFSIQFTDNENTSFLCASQMTEFDVGTTEVFLC